MTQPKEVTVSWLNHLAHKVERREPEQRELTISEWEANALKELFDLMTGLSNRSERSKMEQMSRWIVRMDNHKEE